MKSIVIATMCLAAATIAAAQDQLSAARDLYASASYDDALTLFTRLHDENAGGSVAARADQYRAFCLFALGRTAEATAVADRLIAANPLLDLESDASPRIAAMFNDARRRILPSLIREEYRGVRSAVEKKDYATAAPQLEKVKRLLDEAASVGLADETLADLGVLVDGFLDLGRAAAARTANDAAPSSSSPAAPLAIDRKAALATTTATPAARANEPQIFDASARDVTAPVVIRQELPAAPKELARIAGPSRPGILEVIIDENGAVERASMRESVVPIYDNLIVAAAKDWKYRPALRGGTPVKYLKLIAVNVRWNPWLPE